MEVDLGDIPGVCVPSSGAEDTPCDFPDDSLCSQGQVCKIEPAAPEGFWFWAKVHITIDDQAGELPFASAQFEFRKKGEVHLLSNIWDALPCPWENVDEFSLTGDSLENLVGGPIPEDLAGPLLGIFEEVPGNAVPRIEEISGKQVVSDHTADSLATTLSFKAMIVFGVESSRCP
jgi:hypothetical protein